MKEVVLAGLALLANPAHAAGPGRASGSQGRSAAPVVSPIATLDAFLNMEVGASPAGLSLPAPLIPTAPEAVLPAISLPASALEATADSRISAVQEVLRRYGEGTRPQAAEDDLREAPASSPGLPALAAMRQTLGELSVKDILAMGASEAHAFSEQVLAAMQGASGGRRGAQALIAPSPRAESALSPALVPRR